MWIDPDSVPNISEHQREAVAAFASSDVGLLTGGPGCGKTRTITGILQSFSGVAWVAAPTGKAASRINEMDPAIRARTIHATLEPNRNGRDGGGWGFLRCKSHPLDCELMIVDETSMVDCRLFASLLRAVEKGTKLLCVGDPFQLPPVGAGKPFLDMIEAGIPCGHLTEIHRFAGRIAKVCDSIKKGERWYPSPRLDLDAESPENLRHYEAATPQLQIATLKDVIEKLAANRGYDPIRDVQVICPVNEKSPVSRSVLNRLLQEMLNPNGERVEDSNKSGKKNPYRVGDKVMCLKNRMCSQWTAVDAFDSRGTVEWQEVGGDESDFYCANGETGIVRAVDPKWMMVDFSTGPLTRLTRWGIADFAEITLAYAISGHKSQGSEFPVAIVIADDYAGANYVAGRSWYYTSISRGKDITLIIGKRAAVERHCRNIDLVKRKTFLRELLNDVGFKARSRELVGSY